jgi:cyanocobalamin reductase (cyanide-eliminating) / alkylcobalamin dealkylase
MATLTWTSPTELLASRLAPAGIDLVHPLRAAWYNRVVPGYPVPDFGRSDALVVLVGNTRALWTRFLDALRQDPEWINVEHPLDNYIATSILRALEGCPVRHEIRWAHDVSDRRIAIQRMAHASGFAWLSPAHLSIHPVYGPWIALRAAICFALPGPAAPPPLEDPCGECPAACLPVFDRAVREAGDAIGTDRTHSNSWKLWLEVRDACHVGREHRYSDEQIQYHYTKDRAILERAIG